MNKSDFVDVFVKEAGASKKDAHYVVDKFFELIASEVVNGQEVNISGFGKFYTQNKPARQARNPKTGEVVNVPAKQVFKFKASKKLSDILNG